MSDVDRSSQPLRDFVKGLAESHPDAFTATAQQLGCAPSLATHWRKGRRTMAMTALTALLRTIGADRATCEAAYAAAGVDLSLVQRRRRARVG